MDRLALLVGDVVAVVAFFKSMLNLVQRWVTAVPSLTLGTLESAELNVMYICFLAMERWLAIWLTYLGWLGS